MAEIAHYYFSLNSDYEIVAFTVDKEFINQDTFCGIPVLPFEDIAIKYPPRDYNLFIALVMVGDRESIFWIFFL